MAFETEYFGWFTLMIKKKHDIFIFRTEGTEPKYKRKW
jgi:hypothetical protein